MNPSFISHIDFRVRDAAAVLPLYDALFGALGLKRAVARSSKATYARWDDDGVRLEWFNVYEDRNGHASPSRIAFRANSREEVDAVADAIRGLATDLDGPSAIAEYDPSYYGLFFDDACGNKFEVCVSALRR